MRIYPLPFDMGAGMTLVLSNNKMTCPFCGSLESMPNGTFKATIDGVFEILENSSNRLQTTQDLIDEFEKSTTQSDLVRIKQSARFSKIKQWIPDSPQKLTLYIAIFQLIIQLLQKDPSAKIEYNTIVNIYNQVTTK